MLPRCQPKSAIWENMYLFILLFIVYLIVRMTCLECMSATSLSWGFWGDFCKSLQNGCVYLFAVKVSHWIPVCLRWGLLNLMSKKCLNALSRLCVVPLVSTQARRFSRDANSGAEDKQARVFLLFTPILSPLMIHSYTQYSLWLCQKP